VSKKPDAAERIACNHMGGHASFQAMKAAVTHAEDVEEARCLAAAIRRAIRAACRKERHFMATVGGIVCARAVAKAKKKAGAKS